VDAFLAADAVPDRGDPMGERIEIVLRAAHETVRVVDWRSAVSTVGSPVKEADLTGV
jgi:hypothetical protein